MKIAFSALVLLACAASHAEPAKAPEPEIRQFAVSCFNALNQEQWLDNARCYEPGQLADFQRLYLARVGEMASGAVPQEFETYFKGDITLEKLKRIEPTEFFAAFNGGWSSLLAPRGPCTREATLFEVTKIEAASQGKYHVAGITTARRTCSGNAEEKSKPEFIVVQLQAGKPAIELPRHFFDLLQAAK
jgi:hypothetical protein